MKLLKKKLLFLTTIPLALVISIISSISYFKMALVTGVFMNYNLGHGIKNTYYKGDTDNV